MPKTGIPYDGFYNGDFDKMLANGTFADFRHIFVKKVELGKMKQTELDSMDKKWDKVPLEERLRLRSKVVDDATPKPVVMQTNQGSVTVMRSEPSDDNNMKKSRDSVKVRREPRLPVGALTNENNPLLVSAQ